MFRHPAQPEYHHVLPRPLVCPADIFTRLHIGSNLASSALSELQILFNRNTGNASNNAARWILSQNELPKSGPGQIPFMEEN